MAAVSALLANAGLDAILKFSVPVLNAIYPLAILLIILALLHKAVKRFPGIYPWAAFFCGAGSILTVLDQQGIGIPGVTALLRMIPAYEAGFGWLLPTAAGAVLGILCSRRKRRKT